MAKNFNVVVTGADNTTISTVNGVTYFASAFHFAFRVNTTGQYKVTITYLNAELPKGTKILLFVRIISQFFLSNPNFMLLRFNARRFYWRTWFALSV